MGWLYQNQYTASVCERVKITRHREREFTEFPDDQRLESFDPSDRKYVAVAIASKKKPDIFNAVDSDWKEFENSLSSHGIKVIELCPSCLSRKQ